MCDTKWIRMMGKKNGEFRKLERVPKEAIYLDIGRLIKECDEEKETTDIAISEKDIMYKGHLKE